MTTETTTETMTKKTPSLAGIRKGGLLEGKGLRRGEYAALLRWWQEAGCETLVARQPQSWRTPPATRSRPFPAAAIPAPLAPAALAPASPAPVAASAADPFSHMETPFSHMETLAELQTWVAQNAPGAILGDGNPKAGFMLLGEGPSSRDLETGQPFSGPAGHFLDRLLRAIGIDRQHAYLSILAPRRRIPGPVPAEEIAADLALTRAHIRLVAPKVLLLLGGPATKTMTGRREPISRVRGQWLSLLYPELSGIRAFPSFNPAYLLRRPADKALVWADLLDIRHELVAQQLI